MPTVVCGPAHISGDFQGRGAEWKPFPLPELKVSQGFAPTNNLSSEDGHSVTYYPTWSRGVRLVHC